MKHRDRRPDQTPLPRAGSGHDPASAAGKRTLTMGLPSRNPAGPAPLQRKPSGDAAAPAHPQGQPVEDWMRVAMRPDLHQTPLLRQSADELGYAEAGSEGAPASTAGAPMPAAVQAKMDRAFGADFSAVRIHQGPQASAVNAAAYTQGTDIHFAPGQYDPNSQRGQELLGHELTHVVQQAQGRVQSTAQAQSISITDDATLEREADDMGARAARGEQVSAGARGPMAAAGSSLPIQRMRLVELNDHDSYIDMDLLGQVGIKSMYKLSNDEDRLVIERYQQFVQRFQRNPVDRQELDTLLPPGNGQVQQPQQPPPSELQTFLSDVWQMKNAVQSLTPYHAMHEIYERVYLRGKGQNKQPDPNLAATVQKLCAVNGLKLQPAVKLDNQMTDDPTAAWSACDTRQDLALLNELARCYYIIPNQGPSTLRIVLNAQPADALQVFTTACSIAQSFGNVLTSAKVGGPQACMTKPDVVVLYINDPGEQVAPALCEQLAKAGMPLIGGRPRMSQAVGGEDSGIGVAVDPPPLGGKQPISFGEKRCILAYIALTDVLKRNPQAQYGDFFRAGATAFGHGGIPGDAPHKDTGVQVSGLENALGYYLNLFRTPP